MGLCRYFHTTWVPGFNSKDGVIDPDKVVSCRDKCKMTRKYTLIALSICLCLVLGLVIVLQIVQNNTDECKQEEDSASPVNPLGFEGTTTNETLVNDTVTNGNVISPKRTSASSHPQRHRENLTFTSRNSDFDFSPRTVQEGTDCSSDTPECQRSLCYSGCVTLSPSLTHVMTFRRNRAKKWDGYVLVKLRGTWHPYCSENWSEQLALFICQKHLGMPDLIYLKVDDALTRLGRRLRAPVTARPGIAPDFPFLVLGKSNKENNRINPMDTSTENDNWSVKMCEIAYITCSSERHE